MLGSKPEKDLPPSNDHSNDDNQDINTNAVDEEKSERRARPLTRMIQNFWFVMTAPFPDLRKVSRKRDNDSKFVISLRLQDGLAALLAYLGVGVLAYSFVLEKWSIIDSLYFTCVCFSTVG